MLVDAPLHGVNVGDSGEIEPLAPDEWADCLQKANTECDIAGHRAGLDHCRALPVLTEALVIGQRGHQCDCRRRGGGIGAQAQVGAKDVTVRIACLHQRHDIAGQT